MPNIPAPEIPIDDATIRERIRGDFYKSKVPYPDNVKKPEVLLKKAADLTSDEIASLTRVKADYEQALLDYKESRARYNEESGRLYSLFRSDVEEANDMKGHPKADLLWSKAWEHGHSGGYGEVLSHYEDLVELVK
jgi:hypothetical protein